MPSRTTPSDTARARALTANALALLDVTFEPASVTTGERFDLVMESLSEQLSDTAAALLAGRPVPAFRPPSLPAITPRDGRRAQARLREQVAAGHVPGNERSMRACLDALASVLDRLANADLAADHDDEGPQTSAPAGAARALDRLHRMIAVYVASHARVREAVATGCSRPAAADSLTRSERALMRCLDRCGDTRVLR